MAREAPRTPLTTLTFRLGVLGVSTEARYAARIAMHGVKPKHVALLSALRLGADGSQQDLAGILRVAPSLVVAMADRLEALGAVARVRDPDDRRRQRLEITPVGVEVLAACTAEAEALDEETLAALDDGDRTALRRIARRLAVAAGLPDD